MAGSFGQYVAIDHVVNGHAFTSIYAHMTAGSETVQVGDVVTEGELLGLTGSTGESTGAHLDFEIDIDGTAGRLLRLAQGQHRALARRSSCRRTSVIQIVVFGGSSVSGWSSHGRSLYTSRRARWQSEWVSCPRFEITVMVDRPVLTERDRVVAEAVEPGQIAAAPNWWMRRSSSARL